MSLRKWNICEADKALAQELSRITGIDPFCSLLLTLRNIDDPAEAEEFLSDEAEFDDPLCFADMDKAVERITTALDNGEKIAVFGDYDCDGVTATAVLYSYLVSVGADVVYRLPTREEGYGISNEAIDELAEKGVTLIITVDNGITAFDEIDYANERKIDVVVTDHHIPQSELPNAVALVDPKRADDFCRFKGYAGVGVAFMLVCALNGCACEELLPEYGDLVALGTVADVMPVKYENRAIIKYGLKMIKQRRRLSISALIEAAGMGEREVNSTMISFGLAPRINAAGRMLKADKALELLLCEDKSQAGPIARELNDLNLQRQKLESDVIAEAEEMLFKDKKALLRPVLVICGDDWHHGILGLIAAKLSRKYSRPCIALSSDGKVCVGSARSYDGVSIHELIGSCEDMLIGFGGHETAAGLQLERDKLDDFVARINLEAHEKYPFMPFEPLRLDCKLNPGLLSLGHAYSQKQLEPFGNGNEQPVFGLFGMVIESVDAVGKGNHLKIGVSRNGKRFNVMKFFTRLSDFAYNAGNTVDLAVTLDINRFADTESLSVVVSDIKPSNVDNDYLIKRIRAFVIFKIFGEMPDCDIPTRDELAAVYKHIRKVKRIFAPYDQLLNIFSCNDYFKLRIMLDILCENGLIELSCREFTEISFIPVEGKVDLESSPTLKRLKAEVASDNGI